MSDFAAVLAAGYGDDVVARELEVLVNSLDASALAVVERWADTQLTELPTPLHSTPDDPLQRRRDLLRRVSAHAAARQGRADSLVELLRADWLRGGDVMPLLEILRAARRPHDAAVTARFALVSADDVEAEAIEHFLVGAGNPPEGWFEAVAHFAAAPTVEGWRALLHFTPNEVYYHRVRGTIRMLRRLGVAPDKVFELASSDGITPDAIELAESGLVSTETIIARANHAAAETRGLWLGLAARAAFAQGDRFGTVRFLTEAFRVGCPPHDPWVYAMQIRDEADDELQAMLDRAGIPRYD